ncbi:MAG: ParA family protein [Ignavibacteriaceae bacterium]
MSKIIAVAVPKGGVGKTATAVNLAASLAVAEKKTLLIDFDPSGACSTYLGFESETFKGDIFDVISFSTHISKVIHHTDLNNLDIIPSDFSNLEREERLNRLTNNTNIFKNILISEELLVYDFIIIDCPPYLKGLTTIALAASSSLLIPVKAGQFSITALKKIFKYVGIIRNNMNPNLQIEGILLTMYEANTKAWTLTNEKLNESYGDYILQTVIPKNIAITESEFFSKPAILFNVKSKGSIAYLQLADEIIKKNFQPDNSQKNSVDNKVE